MIVCRVGGGDVAGPQAFRGGLQEAVTLVAKSIFGRGCDVDRRLRATDHTPQRELFGKSGHKLFIVRGSCSDPMIEVGHNQRALAG